VSDGAVCLSPKWQARLVASSDSATPRIGGGTSSFAKATEDRSPSAKASAVQVLLLMSIT
jgi:hypothetical protein